MLTCMTAILLKKIGKHSDPILVGNLSKYSRIPTRSHQDLEAPFHNMITSRSTSSPGILFSTSPGEMSLLPLTPSSVTHQPSMMVALWPNSVEKPQFQIVFNFSCTFCKSKTTCLHVSFTAYEYFYKLFKNASFSRWLLHPVTQKNQ